MPKPDLMKTAGILVAGGSGQRFGERKQFRFLGGVPLYMHSLETLAIHPSLDEIVVVVPEDMVDQITEYLDLTFDHKAMTVVAGGERRQDSVLAGIHALKHSPELVCIHDAARPFLTREMITETINSCVFHDGAIAALPARDTVKEVETGGHHIQRTLDRDTIWLAQTPQTYHRQILENALVNTETAVTDEAALLESKGYRIAVVEGSLRNLKITTPEDWKLAEAWVHLEEKSNVR